MRIINNVWQSICRQPSPEEVQARHLSEMRLELLEVQRAKEFYQGREVALLAGINRLEKEPA